MNKKDIFEQMLAREAIVCVHVNTADSALRLPLGIRHKKVAIMLEYGLNLPKPIEDFRIEEDGIHAVLSFGGSPTQTFVPWASVFGITTRAFQGALWEQALPADAESGGAPANAPPRTTVAYPPLRLVK